MVSIREGEVCRIDGSLFARKGSWRIALPLFEGHSVAIARLEKLMAVKGNKTVDTLHKRLGKIMWDYVGMARNKEGLELAVDEIRSLKEDFWESLWNFHEIKASKPYGKVLDGKMPEARWFSGSELNYVEHVFRRMTPDRPALLFQSGHLWGFTSGCSGFSPRRKCDRRRRLGSRSDCSGLHENAGQR